MDIETAQLHELEAYLERWRVRLEALPDPTPQECLYLAAIELALAPVDVAVRLPRCRAIAVRLRGLTARTV